MKPIFSIISLPRRTRAPLLAAGAFFAGWCIPRGGDAVLQSSNGLRAQGGTAAGSLSPGKSAPDAHGQAAATNAWNQALALEEGPWRELETLRAWRCLAEHNPALAWTESFRLTEGAELRAILTPDPAAATEWVSLTPDEHRAGAAIEAASLLMKQSPETALQWAGTAGDPELRHDMELSIVSQWAGADPAAAAAWCESQKDHVANLPAVISAWAASDPMAASKWLAARPAIPGRDFAALSLIEPLLELEPASALAWAKTLTNSDLRRVTEDRIAILTGEAHDSTAAQ